MKTKAPNPASLIDKTPSTIIETFFEIAHLKGLYRQGWLMRGLPPEQCESVAEHTFGVAVLVMVLADGFFPELDTEKLLRMALIHDFGEIYAGDIVPGDRISLKEKHQLEKKSAAQVFGKISQDGSVLNDADFHGFQRSTIQVSLQFVRE